MQMVIVLIYGLMSVSGLTCFKLGSQQTLSLGLSRTALSLQISWLSILGMALYVCSFLVYLGMVARNQMGYVMPVTTAIVHILTFAVSIFVFKETYTPLQIMGIVMIFGGVILMNLKK